MLSCLCSLWVFFDNLLFNLHQTRVKCSIDFKMCKPCQWAFFFFYWNLCFHFVWWQRSALLVIRGVHVALAAVSEESVPRWVNASLHLHAFLNYMFVCHSDWLCVLVYTHRHTQTSIYRNRPVPFGLLRCCLVQCGVLVKGWCQSNLHEPTCFFLFKLLLCQRPVPSHQILQSASTYCLMWSFFFFFPFGLCLYETTPLWNTYIEQRFSVLVLQSIPFFF